jgi:hexosaminidase
MPFLFFFLFAMSLHGVLTAQSRPAVVSILPLPVDVSVSSARGFDLGAATRFVAPLDSQKLALSTVLGKVNLSSQVPGGDFVRLVRNRGMAPEHYQLTIDERHVEISAASYAGWLYGLQTMNQLRSPGQPLPALTITDGPRFGWRGLMLDVSRHFFGKEYVLATIERMAMLKLNVLHLHLVDDQGWRIEIEQYPKLTEVGAWRVDQEDRHWDARKDNEPGMKGTYGGFYTQDDIRDIVAYAAEHAIRVVPEIEMPAHVTSALAAYPEYSCLGEPIAVPSGGVWPITDIYCPGKEATFTFLENIMQEVMALFPDPYIHVGGDEATKTNWETCPHCQRRMEEEGLENTHELQSYFIQRMERYLSEHGKVLVGWDEILEGGLAEGATVMSWRGTAGGLKASAMGHDVIMTPGDYVYLNQYQGQPDYEPLAFGGYVPLSKVYGFDPVEGIEDEKQASHILGAQANLWSEFISDTAMSEYMLYPRLAALAEAVWTPLERKDWADFSARLPAFFDRLDEMGVNYSRSAYAVTASSEVSPEGTGIKLRLNTEFPDVAIRYTLDGNTPTAESARFTEPLLLDSSATVAAATFRDGRQTGRILTQTFDFHRAVGKHVTYRPAYSEQYAGKREIGLVDVFRGSKNFHDGQWQAWLNDDVEIDIDLEDTIDLQAVSVGVMENQGSGIYFPTGVEVLVSTDGQEYSRAGLLSRPYSPNGLPVLEEFTVSLPPLRARYLRVRVTNLGAGPLGGGSWMFLDEIVVH